MDKRFLTIIVLTVAAVFGIFWLTQSDKPGTPTSNGQPSNHVVGAGKKNVTLIEYGDFECPACKAYYPIVKSVKEKYGDDITFQFRNFPLVQIHKNAMVAHRAAEAAGIQGKFFEMHDILYERQESWKTMTSPVSAFESYASELGLDLDKFRADFASEAVNATINADIKQGQLINATSTPTFVLNGKKIEDNLRSLDDFVRLIDAAATKPAE